MNPLSSDIKYKLPPRVNEMRLPSGMNRGLISASAVFVDLPNRACRVIQEKMSPACE